MIVNLDFITNSSSTMEIVFIPRDFKVEFDKLASDWEDINYNEPDQELTQQDVDNLNILLDDYRRRGGEMYYDNGGDERCLAYYVMNHIPSEYVLGTVETNSDGNDSVFVIPREKIKEILEKDCQWVPSEPKS